MQSNQNVEADEDFPPGKPVELGSLAFRVQSEAIFVLKRRCSSEPSLPGSNFAVANLVANLLTVYYVVLLTAVSACKPDSSTGTSCPNKAQHRR